MARVDTITDLIDDVREFVKNEMEKPAELDSEHAHHRELAMVNQKLISIKELVKRSASETNERALAAAGALEGLIYV